jgi:hypothetical protein
MLRGKLRTKWPSREELLSWWIWHKINTSPISEFDDPDLIKNWIIEFNKGGLIDTHRILYDTYGDFRVEFASPWKYSQNGSTPATY